MCTLWTASRISTSLAYALLVTAASDDVRVARLLSMGAGWRLPAAKLAIRLGEDNGSPWMNRVKYPNDLPDSSRIATLNQLANSLRPFASNRDSVEIPADDAKMFLQRFWNGVNLCMPQAFDDAENYTVLRGLGCYALNLVAYEIYRQRTDLRVATQQEINRFLLGASTYFQPESWVRRGDFSEAYRGESRMRALGRDIFEGLALDPRRRTTRN